MAVPETQCHLVLRVEQGMESQAKAFFSMEGKPENMSVPQRRRMFWWHLLGPHPFNTDWLVLFPS